MLTLYRLPAAPAVEPESDLESSEESTSEEDATPTSNAYHSLLQSYQSSAKDGPRRKRRKLEQEPDPQSEGESEPNESDESEPEGADEDLGMDGVEAQNEDNEDIRGAFETHFANPDEHELANRLKSISQNQWTAKKLDLITRGRCILQEPSAGEATTSGRRIRSTKDVGLKSRLVENAIKTIGDFDGLERAIAPSIFNYQDLLFSARTVKNAGRLRHIICLHALNHILYTRDRVLKNNAKLAAASEDDDVEYRDQGFTRPKILFLLETKQSCVRALDSVTTLYDFEQQENKKRFLDSFSLPEDKFSDEKPEDYRELFEGNDENEFRIGVKLTRKTLKLYSTFYNSDIIFASALGLRRAIESGDPKKRDHDFLSSIEMVIMDQADAALMQNWDHVEFVFEHLNLQPKEAHGCDFSRVRSWYLDGHAAHLRQTIVLSAYLTPKINTLYTKHMRNVAGRLKYTSGYMSGTIETPSFGIKQTFSRFNSPSHLTDPDVRFKYFSTTILPQISRLPKPPQGGLGVLIFIPSYFDFLRVKILLAESDFSYGQISEYRDATDVRKARSHFMSGRHGLLLYTGRAHHFHRYNIRGVKRVYFYGVPENPKFYEEIVGFIGKTLERGETSKAEASVRVCFSKWERLELERIVGSKRVGKMINDKGDVFDFI